MALQIPEVIERYIAAVNDSELLISSTQLVCAAMLRTASPQRAAPIRNAPITAFISSSFLVFLQGRKYSVVRGKRCDWRDLAEPPPLKLEAARTVGTLRLASRNLLNVRTCYHLGPPADLPCRSVLCGSLLTKRLGLHLNP